MRHRRRLVGRGSVFGPTALLTVRQMREIELAAFEGLNELASEIGPVP